MDTLVAMTEDRSILRTPTVELTDAELSAARLVVASRLGELPAAHPHVDALIDLVCSIADEQVRRAELYQDAAVAMVPDTVTVTPARILECASRRRRRRSG